MQYSDNFKKVHFGNTLLFMLCIAGISIQSLRQAGLDWWLIFSISGYSVITVLFFLSIYVFAIFRGVNRNSEPNIEHPLTCLKIYKVIYSCTPILGFITGIMAQFGLEESNSWWYWLLNCELGVFWATILFWVFLDPTITIIEGYVPASAASRKARMDAARQEKEKIIAKRNKLLADLSQKEKEETQEQKKLLSAPAEELAELIQGGLRGNAGAYHPIVVDLGVKAWQLGGLNCMKLLRDMAWEKCSQKGLKAGTIDELDYWWDGIGDWRAKSL